MNQRTALHLREAAAWCEHTARPENLAASTRTRKLRPEVLSADDPHEVLNALHGNKPTISSAVAHVCKSRRDLVKDNRLRLPCIDYCRFNGRFFCTDFDTDECQAATDVSNGFFDLADIPGWDTWVAFDPAHGRSGLLYGWVPNSITGPVGRGMWAIPVECVWWVDSIPDNAK